MAKDQLYSAIANQKLAFARIELAAATSREGDSIDARLARHAHLDSAVSQLHSALGYFVAEVADQYGLDLEPDREELPALLKRFADSGRQSAVVGELTSLRQRPGSWLAELLAARTDPLYLPQRFKAPDQQGAGMIPLIEVNGDSGGGEDPLALVRRWAAEAQGLVDRLRAGLHEE